MHPIPAAERSNQKRVRLCRAGLMLDGRAVPLLSGSVHYFRLRPENWRASLRAVKSLGLRLVDTYVPWSVHERGPGQFDFGRYDPRLAVAKFLELAAELELLAIVRPGPHINAELTHFGIPERVIWHRPCQALSAGRKPVILPVPPLAFPVPSYASVEFRAEVRRWFQAVGAELSPLCAPNGPIALLQVDNEGSFYFRDGVYDQDYHPDAIASYRLFLERKYQSLARLEQSYGANAKSFADIEPPTRLDATRPEDLARHLDWAEFQEWLLADAVGEMRTELERVGFGDLPTMHNLPISEGATPLDPALLARAVDFVGLDYYHGASPPQRAEIARRTSALVLRCDTQDAPAFACELGAGFPPFFPPLTPADNAFTALCALAYGLRGFNLYMAVDRDRWIGAPFTERAERRPSADFWQKLVHALTRLRFAELERVAPVHVIVPRSYRRLSRVLHAFGPASAAMFQIMGGSPAEACYEDDHGLGGAIMIETERFWRALEHALELYRIPYAVSSADLIQSSLEQARWLIVLCPGILETELVRTLGTGRYSARVNVGPRLPERDETLAPLEPGASVRKLLLGGDAAELASAVAGADETLGLGRIPAAPDDVNVTLYRDARGTARVLFVINASARDVTARVSACGADYALDALDGHYVRATKRELELAVAARSVRLLELRTRLN